MTADNPRAVIDLKANDKCCEEAHTSSREYYIPCNKPATQIIIAGGSELRMCDMCAHHSVKNRGMKKARDIPVEDQLPQIGHNNPPDPIDTLTTPFDDARAEAESWLDGKAVETEGQMKAVDELRGSMRQWRLELERGQKEATAPLHEAWKREGERWKPTIADAKLIEDGLVSLVDGFKRRLAAEKEAARKAAWEAAETARREAEALAAKANAGNIEEQREAAAARESADLARAQASVAQRDTVNGLRWYDCHEILDMRAAVNWIATHDKDAMKAFTEAYVAKNTTKFPAEIVKTWKEQRAT